MNSILITGCNRGLGLGLVKHFLRLQNPPVHIFATVRDRERAQDLKDLASNHKSLKILQLDVTAFDSFPEIVTQIENIVQDKGLNLLFNNAGYAPKNTRISFVRAEEMDKTFRINVTAPVMLTRAMIPLLKKGASSQSPSWVVNMSSVLGSIAENNNGGLYPYRASKTALNSCTKSMSVDLLNDNVHAISLHPGWVKTDMGGAHAQLEVDQSCRDMVELVTNLSPDKNGKFLQHDGKELPW